MAFQQQWKQTQLCSQRTPAAKQTAELHLRTKISISNDASTSTADHERTFYYLLLDFEVLLS